MSDMHAKAIEAAFRSRFGNDPYHADKVSGVIFSRDELRRAIAAFLRAVETDKYAHFSAVHKAWANEIADELEQP